MIARLQGTLVARGTNYVVMDVHGVGYHVAVPISTLSRLGTTGAEAILHTHLAVRESAMELYGFATLPEKEIFELLLSVSGVGPKLALAVLSGAEVHLLRRAISSGDVDLLTAVPGIGRKTAQRILIELKEKMGQVGVDEVEVAPSGELGDAVDALVALGYSRPVAAVHVRKASEGSPGLNAEALVRKALALAKGATVGRSS